MKQLVFIFIALIFIRCSRADPINATYDQRQNGKVNVHISIKDVAIILQSDSGTNGNADDDINYDYDYDYDHLTVKPNGIWATLGQTTAAPVVYPVIPAIASSPIPQTQAQPAQSDSPSSLSDSEASAWTGSEDSTSFEDAPITLIQYPIPSDYKPPKPLETLSDLTHPFPALPSSSLATSESPIIQITTKKQGNRTTHKYAWNGDLEEIPVEVIIEPVLKNKQRQHVMPGRSRSRPTRKFGRTDNGKPANKFGMSVERWKKR